MSFHVFIFLFHAARRSFFIKKSPARRRAAACFYHFNDSSSFQPRSLFHGAHAKMYAIFMLPRQKRCRLSFFMRAAPCAPSFAAATHHVSHKTFHRPPFKARPRCAPAPTRLYHVQCRRHHAAAHARDILRGSKHALSTSSTTINSDVTGRHY